LPARHALRTHGERERDRRKQPLRHERDDHPDGDRSHDPAQRGQLPLEWTQFAFHGLCEQWLGWRLGITADGDWQFFVSGD
jgi:hypothetical protein